MIRFEHQMKERGVGAELATENRRREKRRYRPWGEEEAGSQGKELRGRGRGRVANGKSSCTCLKGGENTVAREE